MEINSIEQLKNILQKPATIIGTNTLVLDDDTKHHISTDFFNQLKTNDDFILEFNNMQTIIKLK